MRNREVRRGVVKKPEEKVERPGGGGRGRSGGAGGRCSRWRERSLISASGTGQGDDERGWKQGGVDMRKEEGVGARSERRAFLSREM